MTKHIAESEIDTSSVSFNVPQAIRKMGKPLIWTLDDNNMSFVLIN